jgi:uncharacterized protein (DUF1697 family)
MTGFVALLRAINVGGTGKLPMTELKAVCEAVGFTKVATYIASGNVVFASRLGEAAVKKRLADALEAHAGRAIGLVVRTADEMKSVLAVDPFPDGARNFTYVLFLDAPPPTDTIDRAVGRKDEQIALGKREIYTCYPSGMGQSKLRMPAEKLGTARNMNTVATLAAMAAER